MREQICYWSRTNINHGPTGPHLHGYNVFDSVVKSQVPRFRFASHHSTVLSALRLSLQVKRDNCILDGEFVVYNRRDCIYEGFGGIVHVLNAIRDGKHADTVRDASSAAHLLRRPDRLPLQEVRVELSNYSRDSHNKEGGRGNTGEGGEASGEKRDVRLGDLEIRFMVFDMLYDAASPQAPRAGLCETTCSPQPLV